MSHTKEKKGNQGSMNQGEAGQVALLCLVTGTIGILAGVLMTSVFPAYQPNESVGYMSVLISVQFLITAFAVTMTKKTLDQLGYSGMPEATATFTFTILMLNAQHRSLGDRIFALSDRLTLSPSPLQLPEVKNVNNDEKKECKTA